MNIPNPKVVAANRTARLVREAHTPVYSTSTQTREHLFAIEWETDFGRYWSQDMPESEAMAEMQFARGLRSVSDYDHSWNCWCRK